MSIGTFKRGDTFDYSDELVVTDDGVELPSLLGWTGASQIRHTGDVLLGIAPDTLVATLVFTWLDATQRLYRVRSDGPTTGWPTGVVMHDVQLTSPAGDVVSTETELFRIVGDVTRG